jgi:hypothetical protein
VALFRCWALSWLREDLQAYARLARQNNAQLNQIIQRRLTLWRRDPDLASVRDQFALDHLPGDERAAWQALWHEADELAKRLAKNDDPTKGRSGRPRTTSASRAENTTGQRSNRKTDTSSGLIGPGFSRRGESGAGIGAHGTVNALSLLVDAGHEAVAVGLPELAGPFQRAAGHGRVQLARCQTSLSTAVDQSVMARKEAHHRCLSCCVSHELALPEGC